MADQRLTQLPAAILPLNPNDEFYVVQNTTGTTSRSSGISFVNLTSQITSGGVFGTVTSVGLTMPTGFSVANSPVTNSGTLAVTTALSGIIKASAGAFSAASAGTDYVAPGAVTTSGLTQATGKLLGRTSASTGAIEEITIGSGLNMSGGVITSTGVGGTGLILVENSIVTSNSGSFTFSSTLDGDTDGVYVLLGRILCAGGDHRIRFNPNADTTNQSCSSLWWYSGSGSPTVITESQTYMMLGIALTINVTFSITFFAKSSANSVGLQRNYTGTWSSNDGSNIATGNIAGGWNNTSTNITGLTITSPDTSTGIKNGSEFWLYKFSQ